MSGLTLKRDAIEMDTNGRTTLIVDILCCTHCDSQTFKIYYPKGDSYAHLYCTRCRVVFVDHKGGTNDQ